MDPKVSGKLLTHHQRGYGVDVEALRDRFPLRQIAGKGPKMGSHGYRRLQRWTGGFVAPLMFLGYTSIYRWKKYVSGAPWGPRGWGCTYPPERALLPRGRLAESQTSTPSLLDCFRSNKDHREGFISFGLRLVFLFCKTLKLAKKTETRTGPSVNRLVPKII